MHHVIYVPRLNICFNAACGQTEEGQNLARGQMPSPLKVAQRATCTRRKKPPGSSTSRSAKSSVSGESTLIALLYISGRGRIGDVLCAAGDMTSLLISFSAATYAGLIGGGEDRHHLRHRAIRAKSAGQHLLYL